MEVISSKPSFLNGAPLARTAKSAGRHRIRPGTSMMAAGTSRSVMPFYANKMRQPGKWSKIRAAEVETETKADFEEESTLSLTEVCISVSSPVRIAVFLFSDNCDNSAWR